ncbi:DUF4142 domain-containing protein [Microtetraspora sp. NBRC 16547]|uniref:DUF4142 domain-containing protein n=1 Tax=Microtetraspora sp. NBRC 16547 TaxID=3030993 RepID=UPI002554DA5B|nr:DUF4142 domain-containing protein [Microtetraspora sp. NBRC 16547]
MRRIVLLLAIMMSALVAGTTGAVAQPRPSPTRSPTHSPSVSASEQDRTFLIEAHQGNLAEIRAGRLAQEKATTKSLRELGTKMVKDHTKLDTKVRKVAREAGVQLPREPTKQDQAEIKQLSGLSGTAFNRAWVQAELPGHRKTLAAINKQLSNGSSEQVKKVAQEAKPVVQEHLTLLEKAAASASPHVKTPTPHPSH